MPFTASDICKIIFAIILPPLGVFLEKGCGADFLINICLTILGWIPGIIHAMYVLFPLRKSLLQHR
ncbi:YqaE/Pmp3 family membrane protein [Aspergillus chevalieri]|uniref:Plasma membrane proteolipid Pmp3 n=1 Tax=Aspergillus chevalieri TaxID=182096 RepID=A0A7R7VJ53_ASPCH|nr:plasma membrane proteolipid Pmp3 [Aspergillus chevalieri]BCR84833.1 plasma membrane proteolipid Pmp3 [Aspergillus chevalieri]